MNVNNNFSFNKCPFCKSTKVKLAFTINYSSGIFSDKKVNFLHPRQLWNCKECKSYFINNTLTTKDAIKLYKENKTNRWKVSSFEEDKTIELIEIVKPLVKKGNNILDIGCNTGELLDFYKKVPCKTYGIEPSKKGRIVCNNKGHSVYNNFNNLPADLRFDVIFAFDVVEHLYSFDVFLRKCHQFLKQKGKLVILTGNINSRSSKFAGGNWWYIQQLEHNIFLSQKFFKMQKYFSLKRYYTVYNSKYFSQRSIWNFAKLPSNLVDLFLDLLHQRYDGLPSIDKDHSLFILRKNKCNFGKKNSQVVVNIVNK